MGIDITTTISLTDAGLGEVPVTFSDQGEGHVFLLLHGGGGPLTVDDFAARLATTEPGARVVTPIHPGFNGTPRPEALADIAGLARLYVDLLESLDVDHVTVVGNSIGGWLAAEMAVLGSARVSGYVIVNGVGIEVPGHAVVDFFSLTPAEVAQRSYHDPERFGIDPSTLPPEALRVMQANRATLTVYGGVGMSDPTLSARLGNIDAPVLVLWGEADRIADLGYGRAFAEAIPDARFELIRASGHLPQIEAPGALLEAITNFAEQN
jgi:pimeloyl-ACP methyl ester carboxylesterase